MSRPPVPVSIPDRYDGAGILKKITAVSAVVSATEQDNCLAAAVKSDLDSLDNMRKKTERR
jgi:ABC-type hemin transport system substrate-binding protein